MVRTERLDLVDQHGRVRRVLTCEVARPAGMGIVVVMDARQRVKTMAPTDQ